jgi:integrase
VSKLNPGFIKQVSDPGSYQDGRGLFLKVEVGGSKRWVFRYQIRGRRRDFGLGSFPSLSLRDARLAADTQRLQIARGIDPLEERDRQVESVKSDRRRATTFKSVGEAYVKTHAPSWSLKHAQQWHNSLSTYAFPIIGSMPVSDIDTDDVLEVLLPVWQILPTTAQRVRNRIELILDAAKAKKYRVGENPARWRGHLDKLLPHHKNSSVQFPSMPADKIAGFIRRLDSLSSSAARACEFLILTACRSSEVCGAQWDEFDLDNALWTIPAGRMKAGREHRVPLTPAALAVIEQCKGQHDRFVFMNARRAGRIPGNAIHRVMRELNEGCYVPHGFRSSFRTWAADQTNFSREVCEMALAHTLESKVEAAYNRADLLDKRRALMSSWADFICSDPLVLQHSATGIDDGELHGIPPLKAPATAAHASLPASPI